MNTMLIAVKKKAGAWMSTPRVGPLYMVGGPSNEDGIACDYAKGSTLYQYMLTASGIWKSFSLGADGFGVLNNTPLKRATPTPVPGIGNRPMMSVQVRDNLVILSENTGNVYSTDGAKTWHNCTFTGSFVVLCIQRWGARPDLRPGEREHLLRVASGGEWFLEIHERRSDVD